MFRKACVVLGILALAIGGFAMTGCSELGSGNGSMGDQAAPAGHRTGPNDQPNHGRPPFPEEGDPNVPPGPGVGTGSMIGGDSGEMHR